MASRPVRLIILGCGNRDMIYARLAQETGQATVAGVCDPDPVRRELAWAEFGLPESASFGDWQVALDADLGTTAVVVATPDRQHVEPAVAACAKGFDLMVEKPMAPTQAEAERIVAAAEASGSIVAVCHVLRYTAYTAVLKGLIDSGRLGRIHSVQHLEPIGWFHFAHSFVRDNWGVEAESNSMLMSKSCHDVDWLIYVLGREVKDASTASRTSRCRRGQTRLGQDEQRPHPLLPEIAQKGRSSGGPISGSSTLRWGCWVESVAMRSRRSR